MLGFLKLKQSTDAGFDAETSSAVHLQIIRNKKFLNSLYNEFYNIFKSRIPEKSDAIVELGSGGGFIKDAIPAAITSDIMPLKNVDRVFSAEEMPFENGSIDAFLMFDVLHHIKLPRKFFAEAERCLKKGGKVIMIEPANTLWSNFIYKNFHHEEFDANAQWQTDGRDPLYDANGALPWIVFHRDRKIFEKEFQKLKIVEIKKHTPLRYLISGGLSYKQFLPDFCYPLVNALEWILSPLNNFIAMFETITLEKL